MTWRNRSGNQHEWMKRGRNRQEATPKVWLPRGLKSAGCCRYILQYAARICLKHFHFRHFHISWSVISTEGWKMPNCMYASKMGTRKQNFQPMVKKWLVRNLSVVNLTQKGVEELKTGIFCWFLHEIEFHILLFSEQEQNLFALCSTQLRRDRCVHDCQYIA